MSILEFIGAILVIVTALLALAAPFLLVALVIRDRRFPQGERPNVARRLKIKRRKLQPLIETQSERSIRGPRAGEEDSPIIAKD